MGNQASSASRMLNLSKRDVMPERSSAHHGRGGTVGGGGNCAVDTGVSKQSNAGRKETMAGSSEIVVGHKSINNLRAKPAEKILNCCMQCTCNSSVFFCIFVNFCTMVLLNSLTSPDSLDFPWLLKIPFLKCLSLTVGTMQSLLINLYCA